MAKKPVMVSPSLPATSRQTFYLWTMDKEKDWKWMAQAGQLTMEQASKLINEMKTAKAKTPTRSQRVMVNGEAKSEISISKLIDSLIKKGCVITQ